MTRDGLTRDPLVSVLLPVRDGERFIDQAIASVLAQTFSDFELIMIDDGSRDRTPNILRRFQEQDRRVVALRQAPTGIVGALEAGRSQARGRLIARMDADDISTPGRFAEQVNFLGASNAVVAVGTQIDIIDQDGAAIRRGHYPISADDCRWHLRHGAPLCHPSVMMRADAVAKVGGYRAAFQPAEDYDLWLRLSKLGDIANLRSIGLRYRQHGGNTTTVRAHQNAQRAALALIDAEIGCAATAAALKQSADQPWHAIEDLLPPNHRVFAHACYLRSLILNGGIGESDATKALMRALPDMARDADVSTHDGMLGFMASRAVVQLVRAGHPQQAAAVAWVALRSAPMAMVKEVVRTLRLRSADRR